MPRAGAPVDRRRFAVGVRRLTDTRRRALLRAGLGVAAGGWAAGFARGAAPQAAGFPRLMGMNIGAKNYDDPGYQRELARLDVAILGFYRGWNPQGLRAGSSAAMRAALQAIKARNPRLLIGQYTVLNEAHDDPRDGATADLRDKLNASQWWLLNAAGRKLQWTRRYSAWETNYTAWARPDARGRRWPEWLAERNYEVFFRDVPELDIVYLDNVMRRPRVSGDWDLDGAIDDPAAPRIEAACRAGHLAHWRRLRGLLPGTLLIGNADNDLAAPQWRGALDGAFLEGLMGERWSIERREGWGAMMARYRAALRNTRAPRLVGFNVHGDPRDLRFFRYAYASCLLDNGHFSFTDRARGYSGVAWFAEFDRRLGRALTPPPDAPWRGEVWRRDFERGIALVNPGAITQTVALGAMRATLPPRDGMLL